MNKIQRNVLVVSYKDTNQVVFVITGRKRGYVTDLEIARSCYDYFNDLFPSENVKVEITNPRSNPNYTEFIVNTPFGIKHLVWGWNSQIEYN